MTARAGRGRLVAAAAAVALLAACFGAGAEVSRSGKGLPRATIVFPDTAQPGSEQALELAVTNPGPGGIESLAVAFARVGAPSAKGLPNPIVDPGKGPDSGSVRDVRPRPSGASPDVSYRFGSLPEGETVTIRFRLEVPLDTGLAANSVIVYDDAEPDRSTGVRLETSIER
ncbi:hypothetical protein BH24ACT26_BH24ACT26_13990 [soil metagenome]